MSSTKPTHFTSSSFEGIDNHGFFSRSTIALSRLFGRNLIATASAALLLFVVAMSGYALMMRSPTSKKAATREMIIPAREGDRLETELITISATGFEPTEIARPTGKFLLDVDNRSEIEEVELHLDRQAGGREKSATVRSTAPEWRGALDLRPGVYILSEANHPTWICRITITSK